MRPAKLDINERGMRRALGALGFDEVTEDDLEYFRQLVRAAFIYADRNNERSGVWKKSGVRGQVFHAHAMTERAFDRTQHNLMPTDNSLIDAINYAAFGLVLVAADDLNGEWNWRDNV